MPTVIRAASLVIGVSDMKKAIAASLLLLGLTLTGCGAAADEDPVDEQDSNSEPQEPYSPFYAEDVLLPDGTTVTCVSFRDNFVCDWR